MRKLTMKFCLVILLLVPMTGLSGCSFVKRGFDATVDWSNRMGDKMPVYKGDSNRCNKFFCFGGDKGEPTPSANRVRRPVGVSSGMGRTAPMENIDRRPAMSSGNIPPSNYAPPSGYPNPSRVPPQGMGGDMLNEFTPPPAMGMQPPGKLNYIPMKDPETGGLIIPPPPAYGEPIPKVGGVDIASDMESIENEYPEDERMKPWEVDPPWKKDLPAHPMDKVEKSLGW